MCLRRWSISIKILIEINLIDLSGANRALLDHNYLCQQNGTVINVAWVYGSWCRVRTRGANKRPSYGAITTHHQSLFILETTTTVTYTTHEGGIKYRSATVSDMNPPVLQPHNWISVQIGIKLKDNGKRE